MFTSLQPSRPKVTSGPPASPLFQQQQRSVATPRSQIEAMPPQQAPVEAQMTPTYNPAVMHPVFFTSAWRKPPFQLPVSQGFSPVATGYVFGDNRQRSNGTKL